MAKKNADKSYGWYKAQDFGDYIERVVGEINIKLISIVITNIFNLYVRGVRAGVGEEEVRGQGRDRLPRQSAVLRRPRLER